MKAFALWMALTLTAFAGLGGSYHLSLSAEPHKIVVVVDSSYAMTPVWHRVPELLDAIDDRRYASFSLLTEKTRVHGWQPELRLGRLQPYAPRSFAKLGEAGTFSEIDEAREVYFITNAAGSQIEAFDGWHVIRP